MQLLKYKDDWRSVAIMMLASATFLLHWLACDGVNGVLLLMACLLALPVAVLAHNHHHAPMWRVPALNVVTGYWLTLFYGGPAISWIAVHNRSHHAHQNSERDCTSTRGVGDRLDLWALIRYVPSILSGAAREQNEAMRLIWRRSRPRFWFHVSHLVLLYGTMIALLVVDWRKALVCLIIPQQVAISAISHFNFFQHVQTNSTSRYDCSRNFVGPVLNFYLLNSGYHTVHHLRPTLHWSLVPAEHARLEPMIDPRLNEPSFWRFFARLVAQTFQPGQGFISSKLSSGEPSAR